MAESTRITIEVVLALRDRQTLRQLVVEEGTTAAQALAASGILPEHPEVDAARCGYAIFGREVDGNHVLRAGDRVECLRPLEHDPRARRRQLAREGRTMGKGSARGR